MENKNNRKWLKVEKEEKMAIVGSHVANQICMDPLNNAC